MFQILVPILGCTPWLLLPWDAKSKQWMLFFKILLISGAYSHQSRIKLKLLIFFLVFENIKQVVKKLFRNHVSGETLKKPCNEGTLQKQYTEGNFPETMQQGELSKTHILRETLKKPCIDGNSQEITF